MKYREISGNLITLAKEGEFDVIVHGCNCFCTMGAGIAPQMAKAFGADKFPLEAVEYKGDINKLGQIDWNNLWKGTDGEYHQAVDEYWDIAVVNAYTQYGFGSNHEDGIERPLDYEALTMCLRKINQIFKGKKIGLPMIGCGLAGGVWDYEKLDEETGKEMLKRLDESSESRAYYRDIPARDVKTAIKEELKDCDVTIVIWDGK